MKKKRFGWTLKDEHFRNLYKKTEFQKLLLKSLLSSTVYKFAFKLYFNKNFRYINPASSIGKYRRYCLFTYSGKVVFQTFKLSRHVLKTMASLGYLSGLRKSSF